MVNRIAPFTNFDTLIDRVDAVEAASRYNDYATAAENFSLATNAILAGGDGVTVADPLTTLFDGDPYARIDAANEKPLQVG